MLRSIAALLSAAFCFCCALAATGAQDGRRLESIPIGLTQLSSTAIAASDALNEPGVTDDPCSTTSTYTDASFTGGTYNVQGGFAEGEIAAASFVVPENKFPIKIESVEMIFATAGATTSTTTHWSVLIWDGTPEDGTLVATFSSDGTTLPHIQLPSGTSGVNVGFIIDPNDPQQVIIDDLSGAHTFSVGYRIDRHNNQTQNPCVSPPPAQSNAFPATDFSGVASPDGNWIYAVHCPLLPGGWYRFSELGTLRPSGDWVLRVGWTEFNCNPNSGACCLTSGLCEELDESECLAQGGDFRGIGTTCAMTVCVEEQACCFQPTGCLNLTPADCTLAGGIPLGPGTNCATSVCFPIGACCLPDGACVDEMRPEDCTALSGVFQGNGTNCGTTTCPEPTGACCLDNGNCLVLTNADCSVIPNSRWAGPLTDCSDGNQNGQPDDCEYPLGDLNCSGTLDNEDIDPFVLALLGEARYSAVWPNCNRYLADITQDGLIDNEDIDPFVQLLLP